MKSVKKINNRFILTAWMILYASCSRVPVVQDYPDTANPKEELNKLVVDINSSIENQVNILSPSNFDHAQDSLEDAKKNIDKQTNPKKALHNIALSRAYLSTSNEFALVSKKNLEEVVIARKQAIVAGAPKYMSEDFKDADKELRKVTLDIEKNKFKKVINKRSSLQLTYLELELRSIKYANLSTSRSTINNAIKEGAKKFAPRSLAIAEKNFQDFDSYITANRHDVNQIRSRYDNMKEMADHLLKITRESKASKNTSPEDLALKIENQENKISNKQNQINDNINQIERKDDQLYDNKLAINLLADKNLNLENEKYFNQRFDEAQKEFTEDEAVVYRQGNTLTIRLKGLEFPNSKALLQSKNFALLSKVQKVIKSFEGSIVIIEGHTDSKGGKALNQKISSDRANVVRDYLITNSEGSNLNIKSVGLDYQKPLATNKTLVGRAKNRRVDVVITAQNDNTTNSN